MLRKSSDKVALCYHLAAECRERELQLYDPALKKIMRESEERWLALARSYELAESIDDFNKEMRRFRKRRGVSSER